ncbi:putative AT-hook motif nuclear-localized protein [Lupinus albus]|uniref:Putative AT-hook motif nuclear-localized protein n=1 Tax=Lupinus albus TaxID=3870 RepID=A0A6A4NCC4_LUPAL|nr:putative AT-hook motif nuclear-localized protein [Lupinus albus]
MSNKKYKKGDDKEINHDHTVVATVKHRSSGRPQGSKNKPKPPIIITTENPNAIKSHVFEFESGVDIAESLLCFASTRQRGLCVLSATGTVVNVTLRQEHGATMVLRGQFGIIIMNGLFFPLGSSSSGLTVYLGRGQGRMIGGTVVGPLVALGPVIVMATTFADAINVRLPLSDKDNDDNEQNCGCGDNYIPS